MDSLLENRTIRRVIRNTLLSQKRYVEAEAITDDTVQNWVEGVDEEILKRMYLNNTIDLAALEALLDRKYGLEVNNAETI